MMETIAFTRGVPADESFPIEEIIGCAEACLKQHGKTLLQYHPVRGFQPLREALAEQNGVCVDQIMVGNGSIHLFDLLCRVLYEPGDVALVERPTYDRSITTLRSAGYEVHGIDLAPDGIELDAFKTALETYRPRLVYLIPDFQNPSGATMSDEKRRAAVDLAEQHGAQLVIDVPYRPLRYWGDEVPCLSEYANDRLIQLSSFSKLISPGMRVGWMSAPADIVSRVACLAEDTYITPGMLPQGVVHQFLEKGLMEVGIERLKALYAPRLKTILAALDRHMANGSWVRPEGGFFLGLTLPEGVRSADLRQVAPEFGLKLSNGEGFYADGDGSRFVRLPFCALTETQIDDAVERLAQAVAKTRTAS